MKTEVKAILQSWKEELGADGAVAQRIGFSQQAVTDARNYGKMGRDFAMAVLRVRDARARGGSESLRLVPAWVDLDRLPVGLRAALEHDSIAPKHRGEIETLLGIRYANNADAPEAWWVDEAKRLHDERRHPPPESPEVTTVDASAAEVRARREAKKRR